MDSLAMRDYIRNFRLDNCVHGSQGYSRVLLQLFGYTGHGKSSFINSCKYVVDDGPYKVYAKVAGFAEKPETMIRNSYKLTDTITLVDNRGCVKMTQYEIGEIYAQLGNFQPLDIEVKWQTDYKDMMETLLSSERRDQSSDFIVPVLLYSAKCPFSNKDIKDILLAARNITDTRCPAAPWLTPQYERLLGKSLRSLSVGGPRINWMRLLTHVVLPSDSRKVKLRVFPVVVLTHELSEHLPQVKESFRQMGVKNMFSLENYTEKDQVKTRGKQETILKCLQEIIKDVEFQMLEERDVIGENIDRKRILLEFAHNREMEKQQKEREEQQKKVAKPCVLL